MHLHERPAARGLRTLAVAAGVALVLVTTTQCGSSTAPRPGATAGPSTLRVGIGQMAASTAAAGTQQVIRLLALESLARIAEDGRVTPWLAQGWTLSPDRRSLTIQLRDNATFHDGTPVKAAQVADILRQSFPRSLGAVFQDVEHVAATSDRQIQIVVKRPTPFLLEGLEVPIQKAGARVVGTGPFSVADASDPNEMRANAGYYLGRPGIDRIALRNYPSVRAAWADMLRGNLDWLFEVGVDAIGSLRGGSTVSVHTFTRPYQYLVIFNTKVPSLASAEIRRALNLAIDRDEVVRDGLNGYGEPSSGPVSPKHWAFQRGLPGFNYDPAEAARLLSKHPPLRVRCLVPSDSPYEMLSIVLKRALEQVGVTLDLEVQSQDKVVQAFLKNDFDTILVDAVSGPSLFRPYQYWHSAGTLNPGRFSSTVVDAALDTVRHSASDEEYRSGVAALQQATVADPPALFIAWAQRARAVSNKFDVPAEAGRDILTSIRLWRPAREAAAHDDD